MMVKYVHVFGQRLTNKKGVSRKSIIQHVALTLGQMIGLSHDRHDWVAATTTARHDAAKKWLSVLTKKEE